MQKLDLKKYKIPEKKTITNERQLVLKEFLDILNPQRIKDGFPPLTPQRLGVMFAGISTHDLKVFMSDCRYAKNFSKYFWYKLKNK